MELTMKGHRSMTKKEAIDFFAHLFRGEHHIPGSGVKAIGDQGWCVNHYGDLSTFDFDMLTRFVFLAHDRCCRASVMSSGPRMVKLAIWQRHTRTGSTTERHPTLEAALASWREHNPSE
jgi:hypothetical protein